MMNLTPSQTTQTTTCYARFHKIVEVDELRQAVQTSSETNNTDAFNDVESNALLVMIGMRDWRKGKSRVREQLLL